MKLQFLRTKHNWYFKALTISILLVGIVSSVYTYIKVDQSGRESLLYRAETIARSIDAEEIEVLTGSSVDTYNTAYLSLKKKLVAVREANPDSRFVYIMGKDRNGLFFYADSENPDSDDYSAPQDDDELSFYETIIGGDSGKPGFTVIDNQPILLFTHHGSGLSPKALYYLDEINEAMSELTDEYGGDGAVDYHASTYDLSCFNRGPILSPTFTFSVDENSSAETSVGFATSSEPDGQDINFRISGGEDADQFTINGSTGEIKVASGAEIDYEIRPSLVFEIEVTDESSDNPLIRTSTVNIEVNNVSDENELTGSWSSLTDAGSKEWMTIDVSKSGERMVAGVYSGYISVSSDSGISWTTVNTDAGNKSWSDIAVNNAGKIVASSHDGNVYISEDFGTNWTTTDMGSPLRGIAQSEDGEKIVVAEFNGNIHISNDGGENWSAVTESLGTKSWRDIAMSDDGDYIIATVFQDYVYTSSDGGDTWNEETSLGTDNWVPVAISSNGQKMLVTSGAFGLGEVYLSTDYGSTWDNLDIPYAGDRFWRGIDISGDGEKIVLVPKDGLVQISLDEGGTWSVRSDLGSKVWLAGGLHFGRNNNLVSISENGEKVLVMNYNGYLYLGNFDYSEPETPPPPPSSSGSSGSSGGRSGGSSKKKITTPTVATTPLTIPSPSTTPTPNQAPNVTYNRSLTVGSTGPEVTALQNILITRGYLVMPAGVSKGYYGNLTASARARYEASQSASVPSLPVPSTTPGVATFYIGKTGPNVIALQNTLINAGYLVMPAGVAKGYYGNLTKSAHDRYLGKAPVPVPAPTVPSVVPAVVPTPAPATPAVTTPKPTPTTSTGTLSVGSTGASVTELQDLLIKKGYLGASDVKVKGAYDTATMNAVKRFQYVLGVELTGSASPALVESLKK